jgi:hypothetical protein
MFSVECAVNFVEHAEMRAIGYAWISQAEMSPSFFTVHLQPLPFYFLSYFSLLSAHRPSMKNVCQSAWYFCCWSTNFIGQRYMGTIVFNAPLLCCKMNDCPFEGTVLAFAWQITACCCFVFHWTLGQPMFYTYWCDQSQKYYQMVIATCIVFLKLLAVCITVAIIIRTISLVYFN